MPLFLVRWPDLSAALVNARNEDELVDTLDQVGNPEGCIWTVYRGPLFLDFSLPVKVRLNTPMNIEAPLQADAIQVDDVSGIRDGVVLDVAIPHADAANEMMEAIVGFAFPHVASAVQEGFLSPGDGDWDEEALKKAVRDDAMQLITASWRRAQVKRRNDPDAIVAAAMDAPVALVRRLREEAERREKGTPRSKKPRPTKGKGPKRPRR